MAIGMFRHHRRVAAQSLVAAKRDEVPVAAAVVATPVAQAAPPDAPAPVKVESARVEPQRHHNQNQHRNHKR